MIKSKVQPLRTEVESLFLEEMVDEDAKFLIMGENDEDIESIVPENVSGSSIFDDTTSNDITLDDDDDLDSCLSNCIDNILY